MKKILIFIISTALIFTMIISVNAASYTIPESGGAPVDEKESTDPTTDIFLNHNDFIVGELKDGYHLCFKFVPPPPWMEAFYYQYGKYIFVNFFCEGESGHGFCVKKDDEKLMLSEAFNKGITDIEEIVSMILSKDIPYFNPANLINQEINSNWKDRYSAYHFKQDDIKIKPIINIPNPTSFEEELAAKFFDYCGGNDIDWNNPNMSISGPKVNIYEYTKADGIVYFSAVVGWMDPCSMEVKKQYGNWYVYSPDYNIPSDSGLYAMIGDNIYTLEKAWEKGLVTDLTPTVGFSKHAKVSLIDDFAEPKPTNPPQETEPTEPSTAKPSETVETEPQPTVTDPTTPTVQPVVKKKTNPIKVTAKTNTVKAKNLKSKKQTVKALTISKAQGKVTVTLVKSGTTKAIRSKVTVSNKGVITLKKGKYNKTSYNVKVKITAKGNSKYKSKTVTKTVKVKIK